MSRRATPLRLAGWIVLVLLVGWLVLRNLPSGSLPGTSSKYVLLPDPAHPVAPLVRVKGAHPAKGGVLYFVDVIERKASAFEQLFPWVDSHATFLPADLVVPPGTTSQAVVQAELRQMSMSQRIAAALAERQLGLHVTIHLDGVLVNVLDLGTPASKKLQSADVIQAVNGTPTPTIPSLRAVMRNVTPGQSVTLRIKRGSKTLTIRVGTFAVKPHPQQALIGFEPAPAAKIGKLPVPVTIDAGDIGGPSAGLAFTLEVMEKLGRDVTHGYKVAATGEMWPDGTVSAIGGVEQKTWGVREAGADVFLVPVDGGNAKVAEHFAGPLKIIPVRTLAQALHALATLPPKK